jgi:hypothetical protein
MCGVLHYILQNKNLQLNHLNMLNVIYIGATQKPDSLASGDEIYCHRESLCLILIAVAIAYWNSRTGEQGPGCGADGNLSKRSLPALNDHIVIHYSDAGLLQQGTF